MIHIVGLRRAFAIAPSTEVVQTEEVIIKQTSIPNQLREAAARIEDLQKRGLKIKFIDTDYPAQNKT